MGIAKGIYILFPSLNVGGFCKSNKHNSQVTYRFGCRLPPLFFQNLLVSGFESHSNSFLHLVHLILAHPFHTFFFTFCQNECRGVATAMAASMAPTNQPSSHGRWACHQCHHYILFDNSRSIATMPIHDPSTFLEQCRCRWRPRWYRGQRRFSLN